MIVVLRNVSLILSRLSISEKIKRKQAQIMEG
jgi:hypothetical protein